MRRTDTSARTSVTRPLEGLSRVLFAGSERLADAARVSSFLHGRLTFRARPDDVFVVSYPRSGTTWLQYAVHLLATDGDDEFEHISDVVPWFERLLALRRRSVADFDQMRSPRVFKSHLPYRWLPKGARYLYVVRDGRDVAVSYYHLYRSHLGFRGDFSTFYERFLRGELQYRSWFKHVAGWKRHAADPSVLFVRYEEMAADLEAVLERIARFCGFALAPGRVAQLASRCRFEEMKRGEARFDHATEELRAQGIQSGQFVREGHSGTHSALLSDTQLAAFEHHRQTRLRGADLEWRLAAFLH